VFVVGHRRPRPADMRRSPAQTVPTGPLRASGRVIRECIPTGALLHMVRW
jgi:hypothetical protein